MTFCVLAFLSSWSPAEASSLSEKPYLQTCVDFAIFYVVFVLLCIYGGYAFAAAGKLKPIAKPFAGLDYLVLVSAGGCLMLNNFKVISVVGLNDVLTANDTTFKMNFDVKYESILGIQILWVVEVFFQISFTFFAERVAAPSVGASLRPAVAVFRAALLHLALCNGSVWIVDSFMLKHLQVFEPIYFANWHITEQVLSTSTLFFRFSSFLFFVRALLNI